MIGIVTDSAASLEPEFVAAHRVVVVPMQLEVDGEPVGEELMSVDAVVRLLESGPHRVKTAAPSPGAYLQAIERADQGEGVVVLTVASRMSSSHEAAVVAARTSDRHVVVVDTGTAAGAEGLVAMAATCEARAGGSLEAVIKQANVASSRVRLIGAVGDLRQLARSGRLPGRLASLGNAIGVRPVFQYRRGSIRALRPALSSHAAREALVGPLLSSIEPGHLLHVSANYATDRDGAEALLEEVRAHATPATAYVARFGPVMVAHTGTDILGLSWWWEPDPVPARSEPV